MQGKDEDRELELGSDEPEAPLPLTATSRVCFSLTEFIVFRFRRLSRVFAFFSTVIVKVDDYIHCSKLENSCFGLGIVQVLYMLGDIASGPAYRFAQWLESVRKRTARNRCSGFPHRPSRLPDTLPSRLLFFLIFLHLSCLESKFRKVLLIFIYSHRVNLCSNMYKAFIGC